MPAVSLRESYIVEPTKLIVPMIQRFMGGLLTGAPSIVDAAERVADAAYGRAVGLYVETRQQPPPRCQFPSAPTLFVGELALHFC